MQNYERKKLVQKKNQEPLKEYKTKGLIILCSPKSTRGGGNKKTNTHKHPVMGLLQERALLLCFSKMSSISVLKL